MDDLTFIETVADRIYNSVLAQPNKQIRVSSRQLWDWFGIDRRTDQRIYVVTNALSRRGVQVYVDSPRAVFGGEDFGDWIILNLPHDVSPVQNNQPTKGKRVSFIRLLLLIVVFIGAALWLIASIRGSTNSDPKDSSKASEATKFSSTAQPTLIPTKTATAIARTAGAPPPSTGNLYFPETSHTVRAFVEPYLELGGVVSLGYPLTEVFVEQSEDDRNWYWVQYFEKGILEYHPEFSKPNNYQLTPLGSIRFREKYEANIPETSAMLGANSRKFSETNFTVTDPFLARWDTGGEVARFGYPISEPFTEKSEADGQTYTVQYFERAIMEYHPKVEAPYDVQLTALGSFKHKQMYPNGAPDGASNPIQPITP